MALEGTLKDFSLADIFQLIGIQRKTGVLTLRSPTEVVTVSFLDGSVVSADSLHKNLEDRLGTVLVKSGRITAPQLQDALRKQKNTLQRLGYVLVNEGMIRQEDLREALQLQVTQIVYRLFRWKDGEYHFSQEETLDYDRENFTPISAQSILMEGIRMIDEWPLIERRIRSFDMIFDRVDPERVVEEEGGEEPEAETSDQQRVLRLASDTLRVYQALDGRATVQEIIDRTRLGEFDTCRLLYELLEQRVIREVRAVPAEPLRRVTARPGRRIPIRTLQGILATVAVLSLATAPWNPLNLLPLPLSENSTADTFRRLVSRNRVERLDHALYIYFLEHQRLAPELWALVEDGLLAPQALRDPWGRIYGYEFLPAGYRVVGYDNGGVEDRSLSKERRFPTGLAGAYTARGGAPSG